MVGCETAARRSLRRLGLLRANVYVDGINLYYGALQADAVQVARPACAVRLLLPRDRVNRIRYFTARVATPRDPTRAQRQQAYVRALETLPG